MIVVGLTSRVERQELVLAFLTLQRFCVVQWPMKTVLSAKEGSIIV